MKTKKMKAIDYIREGWTQGVYEEDGRYCALGAIMKAYPAAARRAIRRKLEKVIGYNFISIWNDAPGRTKKQVLAAFKKAGI